MQEAFIIVFLSSTVLLYKSNAKLKYELNSTGSHLNSVLRLIFSMLML